MSKETYSFKKSLATLKQFLRIYPKQIHNIRQESRISIESTALQLYETIQTKDSERAFFLTEELEQFIDRDLKKKSLVKEIIFAIIFALCFATFARTMWFEIDFIPTGSMRPTLKEQDRLVVSKTSFGINIPFAVKHFYFNPKLIERGQIFIFSVENLDISDPDTVYFYFFKGKKKFIKRCMGKPGDTLYFYGGKIYGIDRHGKDLKELRELDCLQNLEHVPLSQFCFQIKTSVTSNLGAKIDELIYFNQPISEVLLNTSRRMQIKSNEKALDSRLHLHGLENYAQVRLLKRSQLSLYHTKDIEQIPEAPLYLQLNYLSHTKNLRYETIAHQGKIFILPEPNTAVVPLSDYHIEVIRKNLYTMRFFVDHGVGIPYDYEEKNIKNTARHVAPPFPELEDGCYEIYHGNPTQIKIGGYTRDLESSHPLHNNSVDMVQRLFNYGVNMNKSYDPNFIHSSLPSRYAYFRDGDLYLLGVPIIKRGDPLLAQFEQQELQKARKDAYYTPFIDRGSPIVNGVLDVEFIKKYGITVPDGMYLALGDNHAMSGDSRQFGFIPQNNIQGSPLCIVWPFSNRWGLLPQPIKVSFYLPTIIILSFVGFSWLSFALYQRWQDEKNLKWLLSRRRYI